MLVNSLMRSYWRRRRYLKYTRHNERRFIIRLFRLILLMLFLLIVHSIAMVHIENMSFEDAIWLTITTVTTVGYGDFSAATWEGRLVTVVCLYVFAISLLAQLAAEFFDYRVLIRERKIQGRWRWKDMKDHLLIINTPNIDTVNYLAQLIGQVRDTPVLQEMPIQILTRKFSDGLPENLVQLGAVYYHGAAENTDNLNAVNVATAQYIILIARDSGDPMSDSLTFDVLNRIQEIGSKATLIVEVTQDNNRDRIRRAGADIIIRPVRAYPELIVRSMVAPGTEEVLENLFTHDDVHMVRFDFPFKELLWSDIVCCFVKDGVGIPMAFVGKGGIKVNPLPDEICTGTAIISLINDLQKVTLEQAVQCLA